MAVVQAFPYMTELEFIEACRALEDRCSDRLDGTDWLSVRASGPELIIKQRREVHNESQHSADAMENEESDEVLESSCHEETVRKFCSEYQALIVLTGASFPRTEVLLQHL
jgi:hypothetical protein